jgi:hypothetical protein
MGETLQEEAADYDSHYRVSHLKNPDFRYNNCQQNTDV